MTKNNLKITKDIKLIDEFIFQSKDLVFIKDTKFQNIRILQNSDKKNISFKTSEIQEVLKREDVKKESFLQINFKNGKKILLTKKFVGFSPANCGGLDIDKLPKVVTTSDLLNVIEAIEGSLYGKEPYEENLSEVKLFFESIACGAESIGFNLIGERLWVERLISNYPMLAKKILA